VQKCVRCAWQGQISVPIFTNLAFSQNSRTGRARGRELHPTVFASIPASLPLLLPPAISPWLTSYSRFHDFINTACMWYTCCWSSSRACHPRDNTSIELLLKNKTTRNRPLIINFTPH